MESQFRILGAIEVDVGGRAARIPRGRALSLLALLLVHRGAIVHLDRVVDELWEGAGPQHARNAVQVVASRLRGALGDGAVVSEGGGYDVVAPAREDATAAVIGEAVADAERLARRAADGEILISE